MAADLGELKVSIGADTTNLDKAKTKALQTVKDLDSKLTSGFTELATKIGALLAGAFAVSKLTTFTMGLADVGSEISRMAPALGMTTQKLSVLRYAAGLSGIAMQELYQGLTKVTMGMRDAAEGGGGDFTRAIAAMGISATDSSGRMKSVSTVLDEIIAKFGTFRDDSNKTALAIAIFGETGAKMAPLLNRGAEGMAQLEAQARSLGVVLDEASAKQAQKFREDVNKLWSSLEGMGMTLFKDVVPHITSLVNKTTDFIAKGELWKKVNDTIETGLKSIAIFSYTIVQSLSTVISALNLVAEASWKVATLDFTGARKAITEGWDEVKSKASEILPTIQQIWDTKAAEGWAATVVATTDAVAKKVGDATAANWSTTITREVSAISAETQKAMAPVIQSAEGYNKAIEDGKALTLEMRDATEKMIASQDRLNQLLYWGKIDVETYQRAMAQNSLWGKKNMMDLASSVSTALTTIFQNNKAAAIAAAVINTAQGITKNLAEYPQPLAGIMAAITAASGVAQIAAIRSTSQSSGGSTSPVSAGSATPTPATPSQTSAPAGGTLTVQGIDPKGWFSGDAVRDLAERLLDYQRDGGKVVLA